MSSDDNKALVRRFYGEIDQGNLDAIDELVAENYLDHSPPPFPGIGPGREGLKQSFSMFWDATPGALLEVLIEVPACLCLGLTAGAELAGRPVRG